MDTSTAAVESVEAIESRVAGAAGAAVVSVAEILLPIGLCYRLVIGCSFCVSFDTVRGGRTLAVARKKVTFCGHKNR